MSEEELNKLCEEKWGFSFTELAKNREELFDWVVILKRQKAEKQQRIDKAIEYLKAMQNSDLIFTAICEKELLEILGDKENESN